MFASLRTLVKRRKSVDVSAEPERVIDLTTPRRDEIQLSLRSALFETDPSAMNPYESSVMELRVRNTGAGAATLRPGTLRLCIVDATGSPLAITSGTVVSETLASGQEMLVSFTLSPDQVRLALSGDGSLATRQMVLGEYVDVASGQPSMVQIQHKPVPRRMMTRVPSYALA